jgi:hypothetical protein
MNGIGGLLCDALPLLLSEVGNDGVHELLWDGVVFKVVGDDNVESVFGPLISEEADVGELVALHNPDQPIRNGGNKRGTVSGQLRRASTRGIVAREEGMGKKWRERTNEDIAQEDSSLSLGVALRESYVRGESVDGRLGTLGSTRVNV